MGFIIQVVVPVAVPLVPLETRQETRLTPTEEAAVPRRESVALGHRKL
jgi:hypothetical protein